MNNSETPVDNTPELCPTSAIYNAKRKSFEVDYDPEAETVVAMISFDETPVSDHKKLYEYLALYNARLDERERRYKFILDHNLLDLERIAEEESSYSEMQKIAINEIKVLQQFMSSKDYHNLKKKVLKEVECREIVHMLQVAKSNGAKNLGEVIDFVNNVDDE